MSKIKVGILISRLQNLGPVNVVRSIVKNSSRFNYTIFCLTDDINEKISQELLERGVKIIMVPGGNQVSKIYFLKKYIEKNPHDVFHSHGIT
ncbi:glycosyltransferase family 1 protein, partial [Salmonella enterica]|nr:glycosyltransferase family 1 protein [Salmonella enterica]